MNINDVIEKNRCFGCGACSYICPKNAISLNYNLKQGMILPVIEGDLCVKCGLCKKICPSFLNGTESLIGDYTKLYLAHSTDIMVRHYASSGGVINSLIYYLVKNRIVEGVIMVVHDRNSPIETSAIMVNSKNINMLKEHPREITSRYVVVPILNMLKNIECEKTYAIVGTPCQLTALTNIINLQRFKIIKLGITCSGGMSYIATKEYKRKMKMPDSDMYYRGDGWPGKNTLKSGDYEINNNHRGSLFERMFSSQIFKNRACRFCKDHFAECSDISFCDFWNEAEQKSEKEGNSCVIIRNKEMLSVINNMIEQDYIECVRELTEEELLNSQLHILKVKKHNDKSSIWLILFYKAIDFIYKYKIYKFFTLREYRMFCRIYAKICYKIPLDTK